MRTLSRVSTPRRLGAAGILAVGVTALSACSSAASSAAGDALPEITITVSNYPGLADSTPWIVGQELGLFEQEGVIIREVIGGSSGTSMVRALVADESADAPLVMVAMSTLYDAILEDLSVVAVAGAGGNLAPNLLVASTQSGIADVDDLADVEGLRMGYTNPGSTTETIVDLAIEGWGLSDVEKVSTGGTGEGIALLAGGDLDVFPMPMSSYVGYEDQFGPVLGDGSTFAPEYAWSLLVTTPGLLEENADVIASVVRGLSAAVDWIAANTDDAADMWAEVAQVDTEVARQTVAYMVEHDSFGDGSITDAGWDTAELVLEVQGKDTSRFSEMLDVSVLEQAGLTYPGGSGS